MVTLFFTFYFAYINRFVRENRSSTSTREKRQGKSHLIMLLCHLYQHCLWKQMVCFSVSLCLLMILIARECIG